MIDLIRSTLRKHDDTPYDFSCNVLPYELRQGILDREVIVVTAKNTYRFVGGEHIRRWWHFSCLNYDVFSDPELAMRAFAEWDLCGRLVSTKEAVSERLCLRQGAHLCEEAEEIFKKMLRGQTLGEQLIKTFGKGVQTSLRKHELHELALKPTRSITSLEFIIFHGRHVKDCSVKDGIVSYYSRGTLNPVE